MHLTHRQAEPTKDWAVISSLIKSSEKLIQGSKHPDDGKQLMLAWLHEAKGAADGYDTVMLNRLITVASDFASAAEEESMKKDSEQWRKWAGSEKCTSTGKAIPTRSAFQWARSPAGWSKPMLGLAAKEDEVKDDDTLSYDDLPSELSHGRSTPAIGQHPDVMVPLGLQAEVDSTTEVWATLWEEFKEYLINIDPDDDSRLDPLTADDIYYAAMSFPVDTGLGADNVAPRAMA